MAIKKPISAPKPAVQGKGKKPDGMPKRILGGMKGTMYISPTLFDEDLKAS